MGSQPFLFPLKQLNSQLKKKRRGEDKVTTKETTFAFKRSINSKSQHPVLGWLYTSGLTLAARQEANVSSISLWETHFWNPPFCKVCPELPARAPRHYNNAVDAEPHPPLQGLISRKWTQLERSVPLTFLCLGPAAAAKHFWEHKHTNTHVPAPTRIHGHTDTQTSVPGPLHPWELMSVGKSPYQRELNGRMWL